MQIADKATITDKISKLIAPLLRKVMPDIKENAVAQKAVTMNVAANALGLTNAATPIGLKAMEKLQELNKKKDTATRSMITFLVINTSGVTIVPTTVISLRMMYGSLEPTDILLATIIATAISTTIGIIIDRWLYKIYG